MMKMNGFRSKSLEHFKMEPITNGGLVKNDTSTGKA